MQHISHWKVVPRHLEDYTLFMSVKVLTSYLGPIVKEDSLSHEWSQYILHRLDNAGNCWYGVVAVTGRNRKTRWLPLDKEKLNTCVFSAMAENFGKSFSVSIYNKRSQNVNKPDKWKHHRAHYITSHYTTLHYTSNIAISTASEGECLL